METLELLNLVEKFYLQYGNILVFVSSFIEITPLGFAIPGGLVLAAAGFFTYGTTHRLVGIIIFGLLGTLLTFLLAYYTGYKSRDWLIRKLHQENNARKAAHLLDKHGGVILTTSLLSSVIRFWIAYVAGMHHYNFGKFLTYATFASLTWVSLNVMIGYLAGSERQVLESGIALVGIAGYALVLLSAGIITWSIKKEYKEFKGEEK